MVNAENVTQWFRQAPSDCRLDVLCRLLECCVPSELQFLGTYLEEVLRRNMVLNQQCETSTANHYSNLKDLREITDTYCRRQLCILLARLKSVNRTPAYNIYDILIQYDFAEFFSRVMSLEEELVDEILLLFTLAANHPAMSFSQRRSLHQRLLQLRETIEKSFKCCQMDVCSQNGQEYLSCSLENTATTNAVPERVPTPNPSTTLHHAVVPTAQDKDETKTSKEVLEVHIKNLRVVKVQQRPFDQKYEYVFEVTWTNGKVIKIHRAYGELFDFQCKLRRRHSKEGNKTGRRIIPYLPPRKPIKFCKGNDILPDITDYVREFAQLPDKVLHSEWVENFFSDGNEKRLDEPSKQPTSKSKQNSSQDKKENLNTVSRHTEAPRVNVETKHDKGNGLLKKPSPKGKCLTSISCKKSTSSPHTSGKLESKKRNHVSPRNDAIETTTSGRDGIKIKTINHPPELSLKSPTSSSAHAMQSSANKTQIITKENNEKTSPVTIESTKTPEDVSSSVSMTTDAPQTTVLTMNGHTHTPYQETIVPDQKDDKDLDKMSTVTSQIPLTVAVPFHLPGCTTCLNFNQLSSDGSLTSSMSTSPLCSPVTSFAVEPNRTLSLPSSPDQRHFNFNVMTCSQEMDNTTNLKLCQRQKYESLFKNFTDEEDLDICGNDIDKTETQKLKLNNHVKSCRVLPKNGLSVGNVHPSLSQDGLLIVPNGYMHSPLDHTLFPKKEYFVASARKNEPLTCCETVVGSGVTTKLLDKNCNYILENNNHDRTLDLNSNKTHHYKHKAHLNDKLNGFIKPYCYNCGAYGHPGQRCLETQVEETSVS